MLGRKTMRDSSDDKDIIIIMFLGGVLVGFLIIMFLMHLSENSREEDKNASSKMLEVKELADKNKEFSVRGHSFKTVTVCLEGKEMLFAFYRGEPQIVNLNKDCRETK